MNEYYILFGIKDDKVYYINNTNPIIWSPMIQLAKVYKDRYTAEYSVLRDWYNFRYISDMIDDKNLDSFYIAIMDNGIEKGRIQLL